MKNVHLITKEQEGADVLHQYLYITSDEEIKEGDWYYLPRTNSVYKCNEDPTELNLERRLGVAKIILTTDPDLIGVQAIDDKFLEWFVKNPSCEWVEVEKVEGRYVDYGGNVHTPISYKIIIPQEEPKQEWNPTQGEEVWIKVFSNWSKGIYIGYDVTKETHIVREDDEGGGHLMSSSQVLPYCEMPNKPKQETPEEAAENMRKKWLNGNINITNIFIEGAKWQSERIPSIIEEYLETAFISKEQGYMNPQKWFEQFKKK